ncbi:hypothetical protein R69746_07574 [Paraburkholderia aspalathi]|nr:hypothetical protein R69746_07574 [Paraburkholderia aspalathi]
MRSCRSLIKGARARATRRGSKKLTSISSNAECSSRQNNTLSLRLTPTLLITMLAFLSCVVAASILSGFARSIATGMTVTGRSVSQRRPGVWAAACTVLPRRARIRTNCDPRPSVAPVTSTVLSLRNSRSRRSIKYPFKVASGCLIRRETGRYPELLCNAIPNGWQTRGGQPFTGRASFLASLVHVNGCLHACSKPEPLMAACVV